jgi:hypothetical protein
MGRFNIENSLSWLYLLGLCYARSVDPASELAVVSRSDNGLNFRRNTKWLRKRKAQSVVAAPISAAYAPFFNNSSVRRPLTLPASLNTGKVTMAHGRLLSSRSGTNLKKFAYFLQQHHPRLGLYLKTLDAMVSPLPTALRPEARHSIPASAQRGKATFNGRFTSSASMSNFVISRSTASMDTIP